MPFCNTGEIDIYYEIHGNGFPLLFISGLAGGSWSWYGQIPFFRKSYKCIVFDNRGAGLSGKPTGPYTMTRIAEDALYLLECLEVERAHVFSVSMGGMIALEMARIASKRLGVLLLGCTHAGGRNRVSPSRQTMEILMNNSGLSRQEILWKNTPIFFSERCRMKNWKVIEEYYKAQLTSPKQPEHGLIGQLMAIQRFDCTSALENIHNPALVVTGTEDIVVPPVNSRFLSQNLPNAQLIELPGAGHAIFAECRDTLNEMAHHFYQKHQEDFAAAASA
ncbi:MAG: alpha/beta hydrolase [Desulfobacteraceae bacterium]|nr:alpha/beta hydrolase [Desulfobacteraceae bacterium]